MLQFLIVLVLLESVRVGGVVLEVVIGHLGSCVENFFDAADVVALVDPKPFELSLDELGLYSDVGV